MSWKGFTKAVARLPHTLASKTGYAETTRDAEFQELVDSFYLLETLTKKLYEDAKTFKVDYLVDVFIVRIHYRPCSLISNK